MNLRRPLAALFFAAFVSTASAAEIRSRGELVVPSDATLVAYSPDPVVQRVLEDDIAAAKRNPQPGSSRSITVTVTVNQKLLQPGTSLSDLSPGGGAEIVELLKSAGADPPALADTGTSESNPYERAARIEAQQNPSVAPKVTTADPFRTLGTFGPGKEPSPYDSIPPSVIYDSAIVCRATLSGSDHEFTAVAVVHPNEDVRQVKKLVAERIANSILH